jgi:hypothetical protein
MRKPTAALPLCPWGQKAGHESNHDSEDPLLGQTLSQGAIPEKFKL